MYFSDLPEFGNLLNQDISDDVEFLKQSFRAVLTQDKNKIADVINDLLTRLKIMGKLE